MGSFFNRVNPGTSVRKYLVSFDRIFMPLSPNKGCSASLYPAVTVEWRTKTSIILWGDVSLVPEVIQDAGITQTTRCEDN